MGVYTNGTRVLVVNQNAEVDFAVYDELEPILFGETAEISYYITHKYLSRSKRVIYTSGWGEYDISISDPKSDGIAEELASQESNLSYRGNDIQLRHRVVIEVR